MWCITSISIRNDFSSGKVLKGKIIKILDKGIIFDLDKGLEGIIPLQRMKKHERNQILANFKEGDSHQVTVQEVDEEYKKIILMMDLGLENINDDKKAELKSNKPVDESEKLIIPQEIIDQVSGG